MNWNKRCRLIQSDPVTCARHFDYQSSPFLTNFLLKGAQPLGNISDWFSRIAAVRFASYSHAYMA